MKQFQERCRDKAETAQYESDDCADTRNILEGHSAHFLPVSVIYLIGFDSTSYLWLRYA